MANFNCPQPETCDADDPNPKARFACEAKVSHALSVVVPRIAHTTGQCYREKQVLGQAKVCDPSNPALDQDTKTGRDKAIAAAIADITSACPDGFPQCGDYPGYATLRAVVDEAVAATDRSFKEDAPDVPPYHPFCAQ